MKAANFVIVLIAGMSGCVPIVTEDNAGTMPTAELCTSILVARNLGNAKGAVLAMDEVERRNEFTAAEMRNIRTNSVVPGMSEASAVCAWGIGYTTINLTATSRGTSKQYVYSGDYSKTRYFYTENGRVTAVQM